MAKRRDSNGLEWRLQLLEKLTSLFGEGGATRFLKAIIFENRSQNYMIELGRKLRAEHKAA